MENIGTTIFVIAMILISLFALVLAIDFFILFFRILFAYWYIPVGLIVLGLIGFGLSGGFNDDNN